jgi:hypothetical protein
MEPQNASLANRKIVKRVIVSRFCRISVPRCLAGRVSASPAAARIAGSAILALIVKAPKTYRVAVCVPAIIFL